MAALLIRICNPIILAGVFHLLLHLFLLLQLLLHSCLNSVLLRLLRKWVALGVLTQIQLGLRNRLGLRIVNVDFVGELTTVANIVIIHTRVIESVLAAHTIILIVSKIVRLPKSSNM